MDDSLEKLGIITDYKLYIRTVWLILGWFMIAILITCAQIRYMKNDNIQFAQAIYLPLISKYIMHINIIGDLIMTSTLRLVQTYKYTRIFAYICL